MQVPTPTFQHSIKMLYDQRDVNFLPSTDMVLHVHTRPQQTEWQVIGSLRGATGQQDIFPLQHIANKTLINSWLPGPRDLASVAPGGFHSYTLLSVFTISLSYFGL